MNGTNQIIIENGQEPDSELMDDIASPVSPSSSEDTMSSDSSKGEDDQDHDLEAMDSNQLSYMMHPDVEIMHPYSTSSNVSREGFRMPERVYSESKSGPQYSAFLETSELWKQFDEIGTEMIVTRRGRRMFPPLKMQLLDLDPKKSYVMLMDIFPCDEYRYKFQNSSWQQCFKEECTATRFYVHPDSPALGTHWMKCVISFYKLKLTNNQLDKLGNVIVSSMHKYQPRLHIVEANCLDIDMLQRKEFHTITFPGTQFMTVTAYQNDKITQLKINNNPFAKGFRHPFARVRPRSRYTDQRNSSTGSDSSMDESNMMSVIHSGPGFVKSTKEQGILKQMQQNGLDSHRRMFSPPSIEANNGITNSSVNSHPYFLNMPRKESSSITTFHSHSVLNKASKQNIPPSTRSKPSLSPLEDSRKTAIRPDPTSGQALPIPTILQPNLPAQYVINSPLVSANATLPSGVPSVQTSPTLLNGQTMVQGHPIVINGVKYFVLVPNNGQPPSLFPVSAPPTGLPIVNNSTAYTSAPVQLLSTTPPTPAKPVFQLVKEHHSPKSSTPTKPAPPPLLSVGSLDSPPPSPLTSHAHRPREFPNVLPSNEKPLVYLQSPPTSCQKLFILPVMTNSKKGPNTGAALDKTSKTLSAPPLSSKTETHQHGHLASSLPIYRFGSNSVIDGMQFVSANHLPQPLS